MATIKTTVGIKDYKGIEGMFKYEIRLAGLKAVLSSPYGSGDNAITFDSPNPRETILINYNDISTREDFVGVLDIKISTGKSTGTYQKQIQNPCSKITCRAVAIDSNSDEAVISAHISNGSEPFVFTFEGNNIINTDGNRATIKKMASANEIIVKVLDANNCEATSNAVVKGKEGSSPNLSSHVFVRNCNQAPTQIYRYDVIAMAASSESVLNIESIEIIKYPTQGAVTVANGIVTYKGKRDASGSDTFTVRVRDYSGVSSNIANVLVIHDPCDKNAQIIEDIAQVACGGNVLIDPAANDVAIDPESIEIVSNPMSGTALVKTDGTIKYKHNGTSVGNDIIRYRARGHNGEWAKTGTIIIEPEPCCSVHTANLNIQGAIDATTLTLVAIPSGTVDDVVTDAIEKEVSNSYVAGDTIALTREPRIDLEEYEFGELGHVITLTKVDANLINIDIAASTNEYEENEILELIRSARGIVEIGGYLFKRTNLSSIKVVAGVISFAYLIRDDESYAAATINGLIGATHTTLAALVLNTPQVDNNAGQVGVKLHTPDPNKVALFKRTITRSECPDIEIDVTVNVNVQTGLSSLNVIKEGVSDFETKGGKNYYGEVVGERLTVLLIDNENLMNTEQNNVFLTDIEQIQEIIDNYLYESGSGGVAFVAYVGNEKKLFVQIKDTLAVPNAMSTENNNGSFSEI